MKPNTQGMAQTWSPGPRPFSFIRAPLPPPTHTRTCRCWPDGVQIPPTHTRTCRCWPDGVQKFSEDSSYGGYAICSCSTKVENEHRRSFPSGECAWATCQLDLLLGLRLVGVRNTV